LQILYFDSILRKYLIFEILQVKYSLIKRFYNIYIFKSYSKNCQNIL